MAVVPQLVLQAALRGGLLTAEEGEGADFGGGQALGYVLFQVWGGMGEKYFDFFFTLFFFSNLLLLYFVCYLTILVA